MTTTAVLQLLYRETMTGEGTASEAAEKPPALEF